ncbi:MerR family transcriptional regulator [Luteolibacter sp. SL250]|uniref:MerR family transcriptional regulator n=1 Tax=Luteolibacter sp. SL250 TaxID=2995170 RepID=UPI00226D6664|nr:MerR family transcriptional regulator [Luteolibacter sp. SL250]WAC18975.1 MerR family transcriptional regulator [Luteolibacter sp. SL250]
MSATETDLFDIRAVSRLTGVSSANLRAWERRYGLVKPHRASSNRRLYSSSDLLRLERVKKLADSGEALSVIAALGEDELVRRIELLDGRPSGGQPVPSRRKRIRTAVAGAEVGEILARQSQQLKLEGYDLDFHWGSLGELEAKPPGPDYDLLILSFPTLFPYTIERLKALMAPIPGTKCVVFYRFAASRTIANVSVPGSGIIPIKGPVDFHKLVMANREIIPAAPQAGQENPGIREPRFTARQLARFSRLSTSIECECPKHLAELAASLQAFAEYSRSCESRNPDDKEMHVYLHRVSCQARGLIEDALETLIRSEGIDLEE